MAISAVIVDDEQLARDELAFLLQAFPDIQVVAQGSNGVDAVQLVREHQPDLLFLDVQMPGLDGFGVVKRLTEKKVRLPFLVFATAYDQYAVQAFEVNAVDYLLKPFDKDRLQRTLDRVRRQLQDREGDAGKIDRVLQLLETRNGSTQPARVLVKSGGRHFLLDQQDIIYARIEDGVITITATQLEGQANYRTIEELQANLDGKAFWRAHRSYLVNLNRIREVVPWFNSSYQLRMDDKKQTEIPVSRTQSRYLRELFNL
jgi:two-component system LytT family response regulator/two-component system response regulator LytT